MALVSLVMLAGLGPLIMNNILALATCASIVLLAASFYYRNLFRYFERQGLKNPKPWPVVGNLPAMLMGSRFDNERENVQKYGKFYGIFHGSKPRYVVADPELLRQVCIKDFDVFPNHEASKLLNKYQRSFLFFMQDEHWKRVRALQTPTFTSGKIKRMYKLLQRCATELADCFGEQLVDKTDVGRQVQLKEIYSLYTMDGIASCGYGLKLERQTGTASLKAAASRNDFVTLGMRMFEPRFLRLLFLSALPTRLLASMGITQQPISVLGPFADKVRAIIESRRKSGKRFDDYLQLLLDSKLDDQMELNEMDDQENHHAGLTKSSMLSDQAKMVSEVDARSASNGLSSTRQMSDQDILANAMFLLLVGLETTATLLTHCTYALAHHPEVQEKLYQALKSIARESPDGGAGAPGEMFDYDSLTSCTYLDSVISETLRLMPPVMFLDRVATRDYQVDKYNVTIPKDGKLILNYYAIMHDPDNWEEPMKFDPNRFMPENRDKIKPGAYCPFGLGPRHCLGMRFSLTEAKLGLAAVMMKFRFEPAPDTRFPPPAKWGIGLGNIKTPLAIVKARA